MRYGYARCSTNEEKQSVDYQINKLKDMDVSRENIFTEYESGTKTDRIELNRLLKLVNAGDTIAVTEVSRLSRSTQQFISIIERLKEKRVQIIIGTMDLDFRTEDPNPMVLGMVQMMGVFSELERNMISQRVKQGLENAKANGKQLGRPSKTIDDIPNSFREGYTLWKDGTIDKSKLARMTKTSRPTVNKYIKLLDEEGI